MTKARPSIRDVARESKVSPTTVSLVINRLDARISSATRQRVLEAIEKLKYRPSRLAQGLPSRSSRSLAILLPALDKAFADPYFGEIISGIYDYAASIDFRIMLEVARRTFIRQKRYLSLLDDCSVDGLLFIGATEEHRWLEEFSDTTKPLMLVNNHFKQWNLNCVLCDYPQAGRVAADYLVELGHRNIGHISGPASEVLTAYEMTTAFLDRLSEHGLSLSDRAVMDGKFRVEEGERAAERLLNANPNLTAIFCGNDKMAMGAYRAVRNRGLQVGADVSIVGCDDLPGAAAMDPPLTTLQLNYYKLGYESCKRLIEALSKRNGRRIPVIMNDALTPNSGGDGHSSESAYNGLDQHRDDEQASSPPIAGSEAKSNGQSAENGSLKTRRIPVRLIERDSAQQASHAPISR